VKYLLDTNVCIALINGTSSKIRARFAEVLRQKTPLATSTIVVYELWYGVAKSELAARNARALAAFLNSNIEVIEYSEKDAQAAGQIRAELERRGERIGEYDTLIAGQAYCRNLTLVTANTREFTRVKNLNVEDWTV
jgi:tRNA(fMet)-specific endonuclease VapC